MKKREKKLNLFRKREREREREREKERRREIGRRWRR